MQRAGRTRDAAVIRDRAEQAEMTQLDSFMKLLHRSYGNYALYEMSVASHSVRMHLYLSPLSCSLAVHVVLLEAGIEPTLHVVDRATKQLPDGRDFRAISPKAAVPVIELPDGSVLTESSAVLQYIGDQVPATGLTPPHGTIERYRVMEWLNFVTTELHKKLMWMAFSSRTTDAMKQWARDNAAATLAHVASHLADREFLVGDRFTVADSYLWWTLMVAPHGGISLAAFPVLKAYVERIRQRPSVVAALAFEVPRYAEEAARGHAPTSRLSA